MASRFAEIWMGLGTLMGSIMFVYTIIQQFIPHRLYDFLTIYFRRVTSFANPYIEISFDEFMTGESHLKLSKAYTAVEAYLSPKTSKVGKRLKAQKSKDSKSLALTMNVYEEMLDEFHGVKIWWSLNKTTVETQPLPSHPVSSERRELTLQFHHRHREIITGLYLDYVIREGKAIRGKNRKKKLYSNSPGYYSYDSKKTMWSDVVFDHPLTFDHLAMDPIMKDEIIDDLITFSTGKDYYAKIGKPWKRGYLLYGPPGTGKSSMIAAMANLLNYDIYDLELTAVRDNSELRTILNETSKKSIIVIEDIDCSLDLTGQRNKIDEKNDEDKDLVNEQKNEDKNSKVTLSGLLNFIDGLWSSCSGERIFVFTTNHIEKLDPALIRRGRMDKHIEMSYCGFEGFKILAKNYLDIESHYLFETIQSLLNKTQMTPADVAENLMPKRIHNDPEVCLKNLIQALEKANMDAQLKAEEKEKVKNLSIEIGDDNSDEDSLVRITS